MKHLVVLALAPIAVLGLACGESPEDAAPAGKSDVLKYQPEGCEYQVSTPTVVEPQLDAEGIGPAPVPDHIHLGWAGSTSSTFAVNWRTDDATLFTRVLYGTDRAALEAADGPGGDVREQRGHSFAYYGGKRIHEAHVCGLGASTQYWYKVGGPGAWSEVIEVATGPVIGSSELFRFAVLGDSRDNPGELARIQRLALEQSVELQVFTGDAVDTGSLQSQWNAFFSATAADMAVEHALARIPFLPANGNHDALALNYVAQFALPQEVSAGERGQGEQWYSFDYGNAHFVILDDQSSGATLDAQIEWLAADLAAVDRARTPWVFVAHHESTYSCSTNHGSNRSLRRRVQPIFDTHRVDAVFSGHDHHYERSKPLRGLDGGGNGMLAAATEDGAPIAESGTIYVVSGGAGAPLYGVRGDCAHTQQIEMTRHFVMVEIEGRTLRYSAIALDGSIIDRFEYTK